MSLRKNADNMLAHKKPFEPVPRIYSNLVKSHSWDLRPVLNSTSLLDPNFLGLRRCSDASCSEAEPAFVLWSRQSLVSDVVRTHGGSIFALTYSSILKV